MKRTQDSYAFTDAELAAWVTWFLADQKEMEQEVKDSLEQCLGGFFASAKAFEVHLAAVNKEKGIRCPKCHGRGHNNLYMADGGKPSPCPNCGGTGTIEPNMRPATAEDFP